MIYNTMPMTSKDMALPMPEAIIIYFTPYKIDIAEHSRTLDVTSQSALRYPPKN
jgi:hypothetical protein